MLHRNISSFSLFILHHSLTDCSLWKLWFMCTRQWLMSQWSPETLSMWFFYITWWCVKLHISGCYGRECLSHRVMRSWELMYVIHCSEVMYELLLTIGCANVKANSHQIKHEVLIIFIIAHEWKAAFKKCPAWSPIMTQSGGKSCWEYFLIWLGFTIGPTVLGILVWIIKLGNFHPQTYPASKAQLGQSFKCHKTFSPFL